MHCEVITNPGHRPVEPIFETFAAWKEAVRAGDLDEIAGLVTRDAEFWTHSRPALRGRDALREAMAPIFEEWTLEQVFECDELIVADGLAVARGTETNRLRSRDSGEEMVRRQRAFSILRQDDDGRWRFARGMTTPAPEES